MEIHIASVWWRYHLRFSYIIHVFFESILYFVVLTFALTMVLVRLYLCILCITFLWLVMTLRECVLPVPTMVVAVRWAGPLVSTAVQVFFARLLCQVLTLVLLVTLVLGL